MRPAKATGHRAEERGPRAQPIRGTTTHDAQPVTKARRRRDKRSSTARRAQDEDTPVPLAKRLLASISTIRSRALRHLRGLRLHDAIAQAGVRVHDDPRVLAERYGSRT